MRVKSKSKIEFYFPLVVSKVKQDKPASIRDHSSSLRRSPKKIPYKYKNGPKPSTTMPPPKFCGIKRRRQMLPKEKPVDQRGIDEFYEKSIISKPKEPSMRNSEQKTAVPE